MREPLPVTPKEWSVPEAETVSFVPLNLGSSGYPLQGFYVPNYPVNVQFADNGGNGRFGMITGKSGLARNLQLSLRF